MCCVSLASFSIVINEEVCGNLRPSWGLRQGDPIFPYLFPLCSEGLSQLLSFAANNNQIFGVVLAHGAPPISHLLFADDSLLFLKTNAVKCVTIKNILKYYELASVQCINFNKSGSFFFSPNVNVDFRSYLQSCLCVNGGENLGRYIELPFNFTRRIGMDFS